MVDTEQSTKSRREQFVAAGYTPGDARPGTLLTGLSLLVVCVGLILMPLWILSGKDAAAGFRIPLESVVEGVSLHNVNTDRVFIVRSGDRIRAFGGNSPHLATQLWWCGSGEVFLSPRQGDIFNADGRLLRGVSQTDMTEFETEVTEQNVFLRIDQPFETSQAQVVSEDSLTEAQREIGASGQCLNPLF